MTLRFPRQRFSVIPDSADFDFVLFRTALVLNFCFSRTVLVLDFCFPGQCGFWLCAFPDSAGFDFVISRTALVLNFCFPGQCWFWLFAFQDSACFGFLLSRTALVLTLCMLSRTALVLTLCFSGQRWFWISNLPGQWVVLTVLTFGNYLFSEDIHTTKVTCYHDFNTIHMTHKKTNYFKIFFFTLVHLNRIEVIRKGGER